MTEQATHDALFDDDDFLSSDFAARPEELGLAPMPDFVERTLARVRSERARTLREAARIDDAELPRDLLAAYQVPVPSADFVARTLATVRDARVQEPDDAELERILAQHRAPLASADFVERTLAALREDRPQVSAPMRLVPRRETGRRRRLIAVAAAAAVLVTAWWFVARRGASIGADPASLVAASEDFSPSPTTNRFARQSAQPAVDELDFRPLDGLTLLAAGVAGSGE